MANRVSFSVAPDYSGALCVKARVVGTPESYRALAKSLESIADAHERGQRHSLEVGTTTNAVVEFTLEKL